MSQITLPLGSLGLLGFIICPSQSVLFPPLQPAQSPQLHDAIMLHPGLNGPSPIVGLQENPPLFTQGSNHVGIGSISSKSNIEYDISLITAFLV